MSREIQISAFVSVETKELLEKHVRATGVKKGYLIEAAVRHHLEALHELPTDIIIHPRLVITRKSGEALARRLKKARPSRALRELMSATDGD